MKFFVIAILSLFLCGCSKYIPSNHVTITIPDEYEVIDADYYQITEKEDCTEVIINTTSENKMIQIKERVDDNLS